MTRSAETIVRTILEQRGLTGIEGDHFLHPDFERDIHDPALLKGMAAAIPRLVQAVQAKQKIVVFGDYDADGIPATALLVRAFKELGSEVIPLIPARAHGYGLTNVAVAAIIQEKPDVLITVDNGTVSKDEVAELSQHCDVIIIDHHEPLAGKVAEAALAIINPKQEGCAYPCKELCGCSLAWKVMQALYVALGKSPQSLKWLLDLVAISTVADMVPLVGENRVLVTYGLKVLQKSKNKGIQALANVAGFALSDISTGDIGFKLAPRINAPSRMHLEVVNGDNAPLSLLTTESSAEADELANYLNTQNSERQALVEAHLEEAYRQAEEFSEHQVLVVYHQDWSTGVIGLVASRLVERYHRPVMVLAPEGKEIKGSVRSVGNVEALALLDATQGCLERYGGHSKAAGLTLKAGMLPEVFRETLIGSSAVTPLTLIELAEAAERTPDLTLTLDEANLPLAQALEELAPYGLGFAVPLFRTEGRVSNLRAVGKEKQHLSCFLEGNGVKRKAIAFRQGKADVQEGEVCVVDFKLEAETWNGVTSPTCIIQRLQKVA